MDRDKLVKEIIQDEGFEYEIYLDHLGYPTFGVGHLIIPKDEEYGMDVGTPVSESTLATVISLFAEVKSMSCIKVKTPPPSPETIVPLFNIGM